MYSEGREVVEVGDHHMSHVHIMYVMAYNLCT